MGNRKSLLKRWEFWVSVIIMLIGVCFLAVAVDKTITSETGLKNHTVITAVVVDYEKRESHGKNHYTTYAEVVEYSLDGATYYAANTVSSTSPKKLGESVKIAINPENPSDCIFVGSERFVSIFLFVFGAAILTFGVAFAVSVVKSFKKTYEYLS